MEIDDTQPAVLPSESPEPLVAPEQPNTEASETAPTIEEPGRRLRWWKLILFFFIGCVLLVGVGVLLNNVVMPWYVKQGDIQKVPNVVGMSYADAYKTLTKLGFEVKKGEPRFDEHYPAGIVVMQLPFGNSETKKGRHVYLTLSRGAETIPVPEFIGMPLREARINAMRVGLEIGETTYEYNDTIMKDLVCGQSIPRNVGARAGTSINLIISRGSHTFYTMMPNLLSLTLEDAKTRLANAGLVPGNVEFKDDPLFIPNTVIDQSIPPYGRVAQHAVIDLVATRPADSVKTLNMTSPPNTSTPAPTLPR